jgi:hypothetical protein
LALALAPGVACCAQEVDLARAKANAALALAKLKREAAPTSDAKNMAAAALKKCQEDRDFGCLHDLNEALRRADRERKPLFIVVGMTCHEAPEIHKSFHDAVRVHVGGSFNGNATPRLLVRPVGSTTGMPFLRRDFGPDTPVQIREVLRQAQARASAESEVGPAPTFFVAAVAQDLTTADREIVAAVLRLETSAREPQAGKFCCCPSVVGKLMLNEKCILRP